MLASSSPYRKALLERLDIAFICESPDIDEQQRQTESIEHYVMRLAEEKATRVSLNHPDAIIIGSDQSLECDGQILGKPGNHLRAKRQLTTMSGKSLCFYTSLCVLNSATQNQQTAIIPYRVCFRELNEAEIDRYLEREQPYHCAGSFKSEKLGISLLSKMEGDDPTALIGLPLISLCQMLRNEQVCIP